MEHKRRRVSSALDEAIDDINIQITYNGFEDNKRLTHYKSLCHKIINLICCCFWCKTEEND
jgi:hypothetical protein